MSARREGSTRACRALAVALACAVGAGAGPLQGQEGNQGQGNFAIPDAPAFTYLGASPAKISRPTTPRDLAVSLADGIDSLGRVQQGLAIDFVPWVVFPKRVTGERYRTRRSEFIYANVQASLGTVRPSGDTTSTDVAIGVKTNVYNGADPLGDDVLGRRIDDVMDACFQRHRDPVTRRPDSLAIETCSDTATARLVDAWLEDAGHWNDFALAVAAAFGARLVESRADAFRGRGAALWTTASIPLGEKAGQLLLQARGDWIRGGDADDTTSVSGGARLLYGSTAFNVFGELTGAWRSAGDKRSSRSLALGAEYRAAERLWLSAGFGTAYNERVADDQLMLLANVRWNVSGKPRLIRQ